MSTRSSSPDPLSAPAAPSISESSRRPRSVSKRSSATPAKRTSTPSKSRSTSAVTIHSPTKMTTTSNSVLSPWRIKVMVEAERDAGDGEEETPSGRGKLQRNFIVGLDGSVEDEDELSLPQNPARAPSRSFVTRTTTTKVPVKGLSSSPGRPEDALELPKKGKVKGKATAVRRPATPAAKRPATPKAKSSVGRTPRKTAAAAPKLAATPATPRRKRATPAKTPAKGKGKATEDGEETETNVETEMIDAPPIEASVPATPGMPSSPIKITTKITRTTRTTTRRTIAPPPAPTLASTRSRRSSAAPPSVPVTPVVSKRSTRETSVVSNGSITPRNALSGMDPNSLLSPSPSKTNSPVLSRSGSRNSIGPSESIQDDDGDTIIVSDPGTARKDESTFILSEGGSLSLPEFVHPASLSSDIEMSDVDEYSPSHELDLDMSEEEALADVPMDPELDFTYAPTGRSHTPLTQNKQEAPSSSPLFENSVGVNSFYGEIADEDEDEDMPTSSILPEGFSEPAAADFTYYSNGVSYTPRGGNRAIFDETDSAIIQDNPIGPDTFDGLPSSSKPRDKGKGKAVEGLKGEITQEELLSQQTRQETSVYPSSPPFRVVVPSPTKSKDIITPALGQKRGQEADVPDAPASKRTNRDTPSLVRVRRASDVMSDALEVDVPMAMVQQNFGNGFEAPPTPESQDEKAHNSISYPNLPEISSVVGDASMNDTGIPSPTPSGAQSAASKSPESGAGLLSRIFTPLKRVVLAAQVPNSAAHAEAITTARPPRGSPTPAARSIATVHPDGETSTEDQQSLLERSEPVEEDSAQAITNETTIQEARAASMERTKALQEEWDRERSEVRRQANAVGAITIDDSDTEEDEIYEDERPYSQSQSESQPSQSQSQSFQSQPSQSFQSQTSQSQTSQSQWSQSQSFQSQSQSQSFRSQSQSQSFQSQSSFQSQTSHARQLDRETAAYEESLVQQIESEEEGRHTPRPRPFGIRNHSSSRQPASSSFASSSKIAARTRGFTPRFSPRVEDSVSSSHAATPREQGHISTTSSSGFAADISNNAQADTLLDSISTIAGPSSSSSSGLVWTAENYKHLDAILASKSTDPAKATKCYKVQLDRPERLLGRDVLESLKLDKDGYLQLDRKESAAVERFLRRERMVGRDWGLVEVVRRVAGMKVAEKRRGWLKRGTAGR